MPTPNQDVIKQELDKKLGISFNLTGFQSGDDYKNQLNVRLSSGSFPDLFQVPDKTYLSEYAASGMLLDLTPYMDQLKPYRDFVGDDGLLTGTVNGKQYAVVKARSLEQKSYWIRKDWLDKLNLNLPTNLSEFADVLKAFTEGDPDGNGKKDTLGLTGMGLETFNPIFGAYGIAPPGNFVNKDGKLASSYYDPAMKDALAYIKQLIDDKTVDTEFISNTNVQVVQQKVFQGQYGVLYMSWPGMVKDEFVAQWKTINPNAEWVQLVAPQGPGGHFDGTTSVASNGEMLAIPKAVEKEPQKLQKVFDLLNYTAITEGLRLVSYGIEGTHYNMNGDTVVPTDLLNSEGSYFFVYQLAGRPEKEYLSVKFPNQKENIEFAAAQPRIPTLNGFITFPSDMNVSDANRFGTEEMIKFLYGKNDLNNYDSFLKTLETTYKFNEIIEEAAKQVEEGKFIQ